MNQINHHLPFLNETIYIIDGDADIQQRLRILLGTLAGEVQCFNSASAFLEKLPPNAHGCLITEMELPDMNGIALLEILRNRNQHLPTIFLTDKGSIPNAVQAMRAEAIDYMEKPFIERKLYTQVQNALHAAST